VVTTEVAMVITTSIPGARDFTAVSEFQVRGWVVG
jgi:hypothetical protein